MILSNLPDVRNDLGRTRSSIFLSSSRTVRLAVSPLDPAVLVAVELFGSAAEVAREALFGRHDEAD